jgi:Ca-activated chloride channel family protein
MLRKCSVASGLALLLVWLPARAQEQPTFSTRAELVVLHVTVEDRNGAYISGLPKEAFTVLDNGRPQEVQFFSAADAPATIGLLIDNSTSMVNRREMVVAAALGFTEMSNAEDELFVLAFNEHVSEVWKPRIIGLTDLDVMRATLLNGISARGMTALYDAVTIGLQRLARGAHTRQVLVIVSDGTDNASRTPLEQMLEHMRASEAAIFAVILKDPVTREGNPGLLRRIARESGGEAFEPQKIDDLPATLQHIARDIRSAYTIGFAPESTIGERQLRKLKVNVRTKEGRTFTARTRGGYIARGRS